jgi:hypothetical protein
MDAKCLTRTRIVRNGISGKKVFQSIKDNDVELLKTLLNRKCPAEKKPGL